MRTLIVLTSIILLGACATTPTVKSVAGAYEGKNDDRDIIRILFHKNGVAQGYTNGEKDREGK